MDGLIDQARSQLWTVVNEFATAPARGPPVAAGGRPLRIRQQPARRRAAATCGRCCRSPTDLDRVSEELFALTTNGGEEYCGTVIQAALDELRWSPSPARPQGRLHRRQRALHPGPGGLPRGLRRAPARRASSSTPSTAAPRGVGEQTGWSEGARLADGATAPSTRTGAVVHVRRPAGRRDRAAGRGAEPDVHPLRRAGRRPARRASRRRTATRRGRTRRPRSTARSRRRPASTANAIWDLVDAVKNGKVDLEAVKTADLPADLQKLTADGAAARVVEAQGRGARAAPGAHPGAGEGARSATWRRSGGRMPARTTAWTT